MISISAGGIRSRTNIITLSIVLIYPTVGGSSCSTSSEETNTATMTTSLAEPYNPYIPKFIRLMEVFVSAVELSLLGDPRKAGNVEFWSCKNILTYDSNQQLLNCLIKYNPEVINTARSLLWYL